MKGIVRTLVLVTLSFGAAAAVAALLRLPARPHPSTQAWRQAASQTQSETLQDLMTVHAEVTRLKSELRRDLTTLRSQLARINRNQDASDHKINQLAQHISQVGIEESLEVRGDQETETVPSTPEQEREHAEVRAQAEIALVEGTLRAEQPDPVWANTAQLALNETFHTKAIPGVQLFDTQCRKTLCRMEMALEKSTAQESYRTLFDLAPWSGESLAQINIETGVAVMYLAREDHTLPQVEEP